MRPLQTVRAALPVIFGTVLVAACGDAAAPAPSALDGGNRAPDGAIASDASPPTPGAPGTGSSELDRACKTMTDAWEDFVTAGLGAYRACSSDGDCTLADDTLRCGSSLVPSCGVVVAKAQASAFGAALAALSSTACSGFQGVAGSCGSSPSCRQVDVGCQAGLCAPVTRDGGAPDASTGSTLDSAGSAPDASSGPCPPECFRAYRCATSCGAAAFENGCCPCPAGTVDVLGC